ncbi:hypothetical protein NQ318_008816, partial [Aromia moschata]
CEYTFFAWVYGHWKNAPLFYVRLPYVRCPAIDVISTTNCINWDCASIFSPVRQNIKFNPAEAAAIKESQTTFQDVSVETVLKAIHTYAYVPRHFSANSSHKTRLQFSENFIILFSHDDLQRSFPVSVSGEQSTSTLKLLRTVAVSNGAMDPLHFPLLVVAQCPLFESGFITAFGNRNSQFPSSFARVQQPLNLLCCSYSQKPSKVQAPTNF